MEERRRRVVAGLAMAGLATAGFGAISSASAQPRTLLVTLLGGQQLRIEVDVPPGTPLDQIPLPGISSAIVSVEEVGGPGGAPTISVPLPGAAQPPAPEPEPPAAQQPPAGQAPAPGTAKGERAERDKTAAGRERAVRPGPSRGTAPRTGRAQRRERARRRSDGVPTPADPTFSLALPGAAPIGVPSFFIDKFRIPPFLLPIYQAAGIEYGVRWEVLAAINEIETDYGRNLNVSSAGALGWMQFMPASWKAYGVDANKDGEKDPYNPVDAIFAAARYLKAAGAETDLRKAIFAYNHADWYVDSVLLRARLIGGTPADLVGSLTGLTQGRFPIPVTARYARGRDGGVDVFARAGAPVIAAQDAKVTAIGRTARLGRFVQLQDVYGTTYTYGNLRRVAREHPAAPAPRRSARSAAKERLFANPQRPNAFASGGERQVLRGRRSSRLKIGSRVVAGTVLGRIGRTASAKAPHLRFELRPAGRGAPRIDPKPILDGWKLLESTAIYRAAGKNPFFGEGARGPSVGQVLLMSKAQLQRRVLANPRIELYECGRRDVRAGIVDRRVLAALEVLAADGLKPSVTSLRCGHGFYTASGNVSHHSSGNAVDIARINGIPVLGNQGAGSVTDMAVRRLLTLQGTMRPSQIISLMTYEGADNTMALPDHADHIHVGWQPAPATGRRLDAVLKPKQWIKLIDRLSEIDNPAVRAAPSKYAIPVPKARRASDAHRGE